MTSDIKERIEKIKNGEVPEGYKKTKVGIVPVEWDIHKLKDISTELHQRAGSGKYETLSISAGVGFVNQADKFGKEISGAQYEKYTVLNKGDFSYNKGNSKKYPQGCIYQLKDRDSAVVPNVFESFRITYGCNNYYEQLFTYGFLNRQLFSKINHGVRDDGLLNLRGDDFYKSYILLPPLPEQEKIAKILQAQDKIIELQQKKVDELKRYKKAMLQKMFPNKGENVPEIRFPGFTAPWEQRKLGEMVSITTGKLDANAATLDGKYAFFTCGKETLRTNTFAFEGDAILISGNGDLGFTRKYSGKFNAYQRTYVLQGFSEHFEFIEHSIHRYLPDRIKSESFGGAMPYIKLDTLSDLQVFVPSATESEFIADLLTNLDNLITLHQRKLDEMKKQKRSLMQLLLNGIVRCT